MAVALAAVTPVSAPPVSRKDAQRPARTVAGKERLFLGSADAAGKLAGDVGRQIEYGIVEQFLRHLDHRGELVRADGDLTEGIVALGVGGLLVNPRSRALGGDDGNLAVAGRRMDHMGKLTEDVLFLQRLDECALVFVRR